MKFKKPDKKWWIDFGLLTLASELLAVGTWLFKYPNNFTFGGVTGISIVVSKIIPYAISASTINLIINAILMVVGMVALGSAFAGKTMYVTVLSTVSISLLDKLIPITEPMTSQPVLEFIFRGRAGHSLRNSFQYGRFQRRNGHNRHDFAKVHHP